MIYYLMVFLKINFLLLDDFTVYGGLFRTDLLTFFLVYVRSYLTFFLNFFILLTFMTIFSSIQSIFGFCGLFILIIHDSCFFVGLSSRAIPKFIGDCWRELTYSKQASLNLEIASFLQVSLWAEEDCYALVIVFELLKFFYCHQAQMSAFYDSNDYSLSPYY